VRELKRTTAEARHPVQRGSHDLCCLGSSYPAHHPNEVVGAGDQVELPTQRRATQPRIRRRHSEQSLGALPWEQRSNATHQSRTDPEVLLAKKGKGREDSPGLPVHALVENHNGLLVDLRLTRATGTAERGVVPRVDRAGCANVGFVYRQWARTRGMTPRLRRRPPRAERHT
jgi:hypothetical protein